MKSYPILVETLVESYGVDPERIDPDASLMALGLDSLAMMEFLFDLEEKLDVELDPEEAEFSTLREAAAALDRRLDER